ncbi:hypothetical protein [Effusibacillus lacus]|uniref:hypothetical protein n=1 Tax=Effusibacillus lacus TaxID=1348429 RepID=UPI000BB68149|nr:hypothetical protein [Effusibacillus lacus]TCS73192.1 hypothetical protein EDD64_11971 [Effusibacillus lacus]
MLMTANDWNETIARFVIEQYSRPFDMVLSGFIDSDLTQRIGQELLRCAEPQTRRTNLQEYLGSLPDNLANLLCLDATALLSMDSSGLKEFLGQALRVLSPGGYCVFLTKDGVKYGRIVPNGFQLVHRFLSNSFKLSTIIDCNSSRELPFQLDPHQYLAVFQKPADTGKRFTCQRTSKPVFPGPFITSRSS